MKVQQSKKATKISKISTFSEQKVMTMEALNNEIWASQQEFEVLSQLMQQVEQKGVERLKYLIELAALKNKTVAALMIELNMLTITSNKYFK